MGHDHHHGPVSMQNVNRAFIIGIGLNVIFTAIEFVMGFYYDSLALLSDATHNLGDVASLVLSLIGLILAQKAAKVSFTYGYKKLTILTSLINAVLLIVVVIGIFKEAMERLINPPEVEGLAIVIVAAIGVGINTLSAFLFFKDQKSDINIRGAFMHLLVDALVSVGVVISGLIMYYTQWTLIDPIVSVVIAVVIVLSTWSLLVESVRLVIDAVPREINQNKVKEAILAVGGVVDIHHVHIWAISSTLNAITLHVRVAEGNLNNWNTIKKEVKTALQKHHIQHVTMELEIGKEICDEEMC